MDFIAALDADVGVVGGKAHGMGRLAALGLPTCPGFVVTDAATHALLPFDARNRSWNAGDLATLKATAAAITGAVFPARFAAALTAALSRHPDTELFSVRSSFGLEDDPESIGAGVYASLLAVPRQDVAAAIRKVVASALTPGAVAYAMFRDQNPLTAPLAVLVHPYRSASATGHAAITPGQGTGQAQVQLWVHTDHLHDHERQALRATLHDHATDLLRAFGPCELEWIWSDGGPWFVQTRPYRPAPAPQRWTGRDGSSDEDQTGGAWQWDAAHNPLPLSPAHQDLVKLVDERAGTGIQQRVIAGYLFYRPDPRSLATPPPAGTAVELFQRLRADVDACLAKLPQDARVDEALAVFLRFYPMLMGPVAQTARAATTALIDFLRCHAPDVSIDRSGSRSDLLSTLLADVPSMAQERRRRLQRVVDALASHPDPDEPHRHHEQSVDRAVDEYLALFGDETPVWDLNYPTLAENKLVVVEAARAHRAKVDSGGVRGSAFEFDPAFAANQIRAHLTAGGPTLQATFETVWANARDAARLREDDDWLYARLQARVRAALLRVGQRLHTAGVIDTAADVFFLPLSLVQSLDHQTTTPPDLRAQIQKARDAYTQATYNPPPLSLATTLAAGVATGRVCGHGVGGQAIGQVVHFDAHHQIHPTGGGPNVLVATTILPTQLPLIEVDALVVETGGPLDHVAAQARERNLPAVVGAAGALAAFTPGALVLVDGHAGLVQCLRTPHLDLIAGDTGHRNNKNQTPKP